MRGLTSCRRSFALQTIWLDLPATAAAFGAAPARGRSAGRTVTAAARFAERSGPWHARSSRRRLYWTARAVFVSDPGQVRALTLSSRRCSDPGAPADRSARRRPGPGRARDAPVPAGEAPQHDAGRSRLRWQRRVTPRRASGARTPTPGELAMCPFRCSPAPRRILRSKRFDALAWPELPPAAAADARLDLATPPRRTRRRTSAAARSADRPAPHAAREPAHRRRPGPPGSPPAARRRPPASCCCATSRARWSPTPAPISSSWPARPGVGPRAEAFVFATRLTRMTRALAAAQPRTGDSPAPPPPRRLVQRHADRRRAQGVQRSPRPAGHGPRSGRGDPVRRLGARRPEPGGAGDGSAWPGSPTGSCGSTRARRRPASHPGPAGWRRRCRYCDALAQRPQPRRAGGGGGGDRRAGPSAGGRPTGHRRARARRPTSRSLGERHPACRAARWRCPAATARAGSAPRRAGAQAVSVSQADPSAASTRAASDPPSRPIRSAARSRASVIWRSTTRSPPIRSASAGPLSHRPE